MSAIGAAELALQDLIVDVQVTRRTPRAHVPGTAVQYDNTTFSCKMAIVDYEDDEIDGSLIKRTDQKGILLGKEISTLKVNDVIDDSTGTFRVHHRKPYRVGSDTAAVEIQLRPV